LIRFNSTNNIFRIIPNVTNWLVCEFCEITSVVYEFPSVVKAVSELV
jgi:hypothetical protein